MKIKPLVIYHAGCADGFGAAFSAWMKFKDNAEYEPYSYNEKIHPADWIELVQDRDVYILDFSFPKPVMELAFEHAKSVTWLDHHKTAFEMWCGEGYLDDKKSAYILGFNGHWIELDNNRSGALISWNFFHPGKKVPILIQHIDDGDRWQFKIEHTKAFTKALWSETPWTFGQWVSFYYMDETDRSALSYYNSFVQEGYAILRAHEQQVKTIVKNTTMDCHIEFLMDLNHLGSELVTEKGLVSNCPSHLTSDVGHELATLSGTYGLAWYMGKDCRINGSLRSNGNYDVSVIAKALGGGGHKNAAGFEIDINTLMKWIKNGT